MAKQTINIGTSANNGTGDPLRTAFTKINQNFTELYNRPVFSGSYNDLTNKPTIPVDISNLTDTTNLLGGGNANTGDVTFDGVKVIGSGTASGDGAGYATLELVPDNNLYNNGQYLVIDPTAPSHIHIRAGGLQDQSNADLFLGGEKNYVRVRDNQGVRLQNEQITEQFWYYNNETDFNTGTWFEENGNYYIQFTTTNQEMISKFWEFTNGGQNRVVINQNDTVEFGGWGGSLGNDAYKVQVLTAPPASPTNLTSLEFQLFVTNTNSIQLENNDFRVDVQDDIRMFGRDIFRLMNYSVEEPIEITTDYDNNSWTWRFQPDGTMQFPAGGSFNVSTTVPASSIGSPGDKAGCVVFDTTHLYYCTADYGQVGHQVSVATAYNGATSLNTNSFQLTKSADTLQITVGDIISDSDGGATSIVDSVSSDDNYTYVGTGAMAYQAVFPLTFTSTDYVSGGNIWKRIAWSNDTW